MTERKKWECDLCEFERETYNSTSVLEGELMWFFVQRVSGWDSVQQCWLRAMSVCFTCEAGRMLEIVELDDAVCTDIRGPVKLHQFLAQLSACAMLVALCWEVFCACNGSAKTLAHWGSVFLVNFVRRSGTEQKHSCVVSTNLRLPLSPHATSRLRIPIKAFPFRFLSRLPLQASL